MGLHCLPQKPSYFWRGGGNRTVIVLADQNFPGLLPSVEGKCLAIIRLEKGTMTELVDFAINIAKSVTVPSGTVFLVGSLSHLEKVGTQSYATACINAKRRLMGAFKKCEVVPFVPPPLGGCNNPELIRDIADSAMWLGGLSHSPISATMSGLVLMVMKSGGEGGDGVHYDRPVSLPMSLDEYKIEQKISPGRPGIPAILPPWSQTDEKTYMDNLISDINREFIAGIDPNPNLSRSAKRPAMYPALRSGAVEVALIIGGSNVRDLAYAMSSLGVETYKLATGGWKLSKENVDKILPDLRELLSGLPENTPIVFFCLDNSSFLAASEEGGLVPISKCVPEDDGYHVAGALVVAPELAMQYAIAQLKRAIAECGAFPVFIITPWTRFVSQPCCAEAGHVTNFQDPDFLADILRDLNKQKFHLRKCLALATVLDGIQLVCGESCSLERKEQTMRAGWASDPVHPNGHIYAKMALNLIEKIAPTSNTGGSSQEGSRKRSWSASNRDEGERSQDRRSGGAGGGGNSGQWRQDGGNRFASGSGYGSGYNNPTARSTSWKYGSKGGGGQGGGHSGNFGSSYGGYDSAGKRGRGNSRGGGGGSGRSGGNAGKGGYRNY